MLTNLFRIMFTRSFEPLKLTDRSDYNLSTEEKDTGLYVHIPFCRTLCPFCPYNKVKYDKNLIKPYKEALIKEINLIGKACNGKNNVTSVYFGGGSPALMLEELGEIMTALKKNFSISSNIGIELHPEDVNENSLKSLRNIGFDMVSIGIQSFSRECLNTLGRKYIEGTEKVKLANEAGFKVIDVDLIFGIYNQTGQDLKDDFITAFEAGATQVSTYPFIDFSYAHNKRKPLGKKEKKRLLEVLERTSSEIDCDRTAVWTFGKKNVPKYSSITRDTFIGFGASAASLTKSYFRINTFSIEEYIKSLKGNRIPTALTMKFTERTRALYWLFWNAYTLKLDNAQFEGLFDVKLEQMFKTELKAAHKLGLLNKINENYELTAKGTYLYHLIEQNYTNKYIDKTWSIARKEAWPKEVRLY